MKLELSPKQADLLLDSIYSRAFELNETLKSAKEGWGACREVESELLELSKLQSALVYLHSK